MVLPSSGPLSLNSIAGEFGGSTPHGLNEYYRSGYGIPVSGTISIGDFYSASVEPIQGYWVGMYYLKSDAYKITYSTDTTALTPANLSLARAEGGATGNASDGYYAGGKKAGNTPTTRTDRITYSTNSRSSLPAIAITQRAHLAATSTSTSGYFAGGGNTSGSINNTEIQRINYASATKTALPAANLTRNFRDHSGSDTKTAGYFIGGRQISPSIVSFSSVDKITYSTNTTATLPSANLPRTQYNGGATGNQSVGFVGGGSASGGGVPSSFRTSEMFKLTYSTNTSAYSPSAFLSEARYNVGATGNFSKGYWCSGSIPSPAYYTSRTDKVTFSTSTSSVAPGAALFATTEARGT